MSIEKVLRRGAGATFFNLQIRKAKNAMLVGHLEAKPVLKLIGEK